MTFSIAKRKGEFIDITAVVSNHNDLRDMVERQGHNFIHMPVTPNSKIEQESQLQRVLNDRISDLG